MTGRGKRAPTVQVFPTSPVFLVDDSPIRRQPIHPERARPQAYFDAFEDSALFYDCFRADTGEIMLVGPPPLNLEPILKKAAYLALPSGRPLTPSIRISRSTATTVLQDAPPDTDAITIRFEGFEQSVPVQPAMSDVLAGQRVMFTMSKDNDLAWIEMWARWHCRMHGVNAIVIFDNGSTRYGADAIVETLSGIDGLETIGLVSWPYRYGPVDPAVYTHHYWANFLQVASFALMLRRFGARSEGLLNCDIDELVGQTNGMDVFSLARSSSRGFVRLKGTWIEPIPEDDSASAELPAHLAFSFRRRNPLLARCADKWVLAPGRRWMRDLSIVPMMHRIYGLPRLYAFIAPWAPFWHFRGINTNWKEDRAAPTPFDMRRHIQDAGWLEHRQIFLDSISLPDESSDAARPNQSSNRDHSR